MRSACIVREAPEKGALEAIREYAETIDKIARRIEEALVPDGQPVKAPVMSGV